MLNNRIILRRISQSRRNLLSVLNGNTPAVTQHTPHLVNLGDSVNNPWQQARDPQGQIYWWNPITNETTPVGSIKPAHWVEVSDPNGTSKTYWWNPETNQTTQLGAPRPPSIPILFQEVEFEKPSLGKVLVRSAVIGGGLTLGLMLAMSIFG